MASPEPGSPEPYSTHTVKDGAISGELPAAESFAVHYPGYPSSTDRAVETLGGLPEIAKALSSDSSNLELRFRPEDPYSHPAIAELRPCSSLLLKISKTKGDSGADKLSADVVARVNQAFQFHGMVDYQHVIGVHAAESRRKRQRTSEGTESLSGDADAAEKGDGTGSDEDDVMMLVPKFFAHKNMPETIVLNPSVNLFSKNMQKGIVEHRWEMDIEPCLAIAFDIERIPVKINWGDNISKDTNEWEWHMAVTKLFEERPIWPRWSLYERLLDDGLQVTGHHLRRLLFRIGYYFSTGPFGRFWIRKGYDPRKDSESRIFQKVDFRMAPQLRNLFDTITNPKSEQSWKDICQFQALPSKTFVCLQFFELSDDFIQQEIRKPSTQTTCTHATGWFSRPLIRTLRLRVSMRLLALFPMEGAKGMLKSTCEQFERSKKVEALSRLREPEKENQNVNREFDHSAVVPFAKPNVSKHDYNISAEVPCAEANDSENQPEDESNDGEIEDDEEEEEEEEQDGYASPPVAGEDGTFSLDASSYKIGECVPTDYLHDLLRGLPFSKDGKGLKPTDEINGVDSSDGEYQILEQDSDDDDEYYDDG